MMTFSTRRLLLVLPAGIAYLWITRGLCVSYPNLPIDDAYIHLQFIKNWAAGLGLCFNPGEFSLGCTSYLYVVTGGTLERLYESLVGSAPDLVALVRVFGILCGMGILLVAWRWLSERNAHPLAIGFGLLFLGMSRPFTSTATSGMETIYFSLVVFILMRMAEDDRPGVQALAGLVCGCVYLIRPDGLLAILCYLFVRIVSLWLRPESRTPDVLYGMFYWLLLAIPLPFFFADYCMTTTGHPLPTPYGSKIVHHVPGFLSDTLSGRLNRAWEELLFAAKQFVQCAPTPHIVLGIAWLFRVAGLPTRLRQGQDRRAFSELAAVCYTVSLPFLFAIFFPTRQGFGGWYIRYLEPAYPLFVATGVLGLHDLAERAPQWIRRAFSGQRAVPRAALHWAFGLVLLVGVYQQQANTYYAYHLLSDVKNAYRFAIAEWIDENLPTDSIVAIGAPGLGVIGYASNRTIVDQASLIDHRAVEWYRRPESLADPAWGRNHYFAWRNVDHYVHICISGEDPLFEKRIEIPNTTGMDLKFVGLEPMCIYAFRPPPDVVREARAFR